MEKCGEEEEKGEEKSITLKTVWDEVLALRDVSINAPLNTGNAPTLNDGETGNAPTLICFISISVRLFRVRAPNNST